MDSHDVLMLINYYCIITVEYKYMFDIEAGNVDDKIKEAKK